MIFNFHKNKLMFSYQHLKNTSYGNDYLYKNVDIKKLLKIYTDKDTTLSYVSIISQFNNKIYPVFDLDDQEKLDFFEELYIDRNYVIFSSSPDHYWAILDSQQKNVKYIFSDLKWNKCNDPKYVKFSKQYNLIRIRGIYDNLTRKPHIIKKNGILSENFSLFIKQLEDFYNNEGLKISATRYNDKNLIVLYNRKVKLEKLDTL